jgi:exosortase D (VPLPA-CTERM-specific)
MSTRYADPPSTQDRAAPLARFRWWQLMPAALAVAMAVLYADSVFRVLQTFYRVPEFGHGFLIIAVSGWLIWKRRHLVWAHRTPGSMWGLPLVVAGAAFTALTHAAGLVSGPYLGLVPVLIGLSLTTFGLRAGLFLLAPLALLLTSYPLPTYAYIKLSTTLQLISSQLGAGMLDLIGVPVFLDGNIIDLGVYKLQVAEACSGLRYLFPLFSFGVMCAYLYRGKLWEKILIVGMTVPLTIVLNSTRIAVTGLIVEYGNRSWAEGFTHLFEGWVVFLIALLALFGLMWLLRRMGGRGAGIGDMLDFDRIAGRQAEAVAPSSPALRAQSFPQTLPRAFVWSVATLVMAAVLLAPLALRPQTVPDRPGLVVYPLRIGEWSGTPAFLPPGVARELAADDYLLADYRHADTGDVVNLWVAYYGSQLGDSQMHLPTTCLPGAGWEYVEFNAHRTPVIKDDGSSLTVNRGLIVNGTDRILMYFWMEMRGESVFRAQNIKLINLRDSILMGRSDGALLRVYTALEVGETVEAAEQRLDTFLAKTYPHLAPHTGL